MNSTQEKIINTAIKLFLEEGFHAVGVNKIAAEAGVTKKTLYYHFESKDKLIVEALKIHHGDFIESFGGQVLSRADTPKEQIIAVFDVARDWFEGGDNFYGCLFINAISEYPEAKSAVRESVKAFKGHVQAFIEGLATEAGFENPEIIAKQIGLLLEGAIVVAQTSGSSHSAQEAKAMARQLLGL